LDVGPGDVAGTIDASAAATRKNIQGIRKAYNDHKRRTYKFFSTINFPRR
jgi:hypothetical protein